MADASSAHLPHPAPIDAYGNGGFRFGGMSHRGSILCLPAGIWAWPVTRPEDITEETLAVVLSQPEPVRHLIVGTGSDLVMLPRPLLLRLRARPMAVECMATGAAARTYNILMAERRPVAAALLAVP